MPNIRNPYKVFTVPVAQRSALSRFLFQNVAQRVIPFTALRAGVPELAGLTDAQLRALAVELSLEVEEV